VFVVNLANGKPLLSKRGVVIEVDDDGSPEAMQTLEGALLPTINAMQAAIEEGVPVLVHCHAGRQRSAAIVAACIMKFKGSGLNATLEHMKSRKRDVFFPEANFLPVLQRFERALMNKQPQRQNP
jgi:protein-tyrosine phosphatase